MIAILRSQGVNCFHPFARQDIDRSSQLAGLVLDKKNRICNTFQSEVKPLRLISIFLNYFTVFFFIKAGLSSRSDGGRGVCGLRDGT